MPDLIHDARIDQVGRVARTGCGGVGRRWFLSGEKTQHELDRDVQRWDFGDYFVEHGIGVDTSRFGIEGQDDAMT